MKYLTSPHGYWMINDADELFWYPSETHYLHNKKWSKQIGIKASESNAIKDYSEISEEDLMLELL